MAEVAIRNFTRQHKNVWAGLPFSAVAQEVLPDWDISLVFAGRTRAQALNKKLRNKTYVPNVLSYVVGKKSGEIIICLTEARRQAPAYHLHTGSYILFLFIHGLLHLEGRAHGATMEKCEQELLARFARSSVRTYLHVTTHNHRDRHRHLPGEDRRR